MTDIILQRGNVPLIVEPSKSVANLL